jgi:hypothetical protein
MSRVGTSYTSPAITVYSPAHLFLANNVTHLLCQKHGLLQKGNFSLPGCTRSKDKQKIPQQLQVMDDFLTVPWQVVALQLTVVTGPSTRSSVAVSVQDDHATSVVPSETAAHETTAVRAFRRSLGWSAGTSHSGLVHPSAAGECGDGDTGSRGRPDRRRPATAWLGRASPSLGSIAECRAPRARTGASGPRARTKRAIRGSISAALWPSTWRAWLPGARRDCEQCPKHRPWRRWPKPQSACAPSLVKCSATHGRHRHHNEQ